MIGWGGGVEGVGRKPAFCGRNFESAVFTISCAYVISYLLSYWEEIISIRILSTYVC